MAYYRPSHFRIAKTGWFLGLTELVHISEEAGKLVFYDGLGSKPVRLRPVGPHQVLRLEKQGYTPELTLVHDDLHEAVLVRAFGAGIQANTAIKTSAFGAWLPVVLSHLSLLIIGFCVLLGLGWLGCGVWLWRKGRRLSALPVRISLYVYGLSYVVMLILLNGEGNHLGVVSPQSITVFVTSVLGPLAALGALIGLLSRYRQISGRLDLLILSVATGSAMLVVGYLGVWGLIGFQTWA